MAGDAAPVSRVVQFGNPADPTADERRQMNLGARLFTIFLALPAFGLLAYSALANAGLAWALSPTQADAVAHVILALLISLAVGFLPLAAGVLWQNEQKKPKYERNYTLATTALIIFLPLWALSIAAAIGHIEFTRQTTGLPTPRGIATVPAIDPRHIAAIERDIALFHTRLHTIRADNGDRFMPVTGDWLIDHTNGCKAFRYDDERVRCKYLAELNDELAARRLIDGVNEPSKASVLRDFVPEWAIPKLQVGSTGYFHLASAILYPVLMAIAFAVIDIFMTPPDKPSYASAITTPVDVKKVDSFKEWWRDCVTIDQNVRGVHFKDIFQNYEDWSWANTGSPQYGKTEFANKLKSHVASDTQGLVKRKSGGVVYDGISL